MKSKSKLHFFETPCRNSESVVKRLGPGMGVSRIFNCSIFFQFIDLIFYLLFYSIIHSTVFTCFSLSWSWWSLVYLPPLIALLSPIVHLQHTDSMYLALLTDTVFSFSEISRGRGILNKTVLVLQYCISYNGAHRYEQFLQFGQLYQDLILLGLALCLPSASVSSVFNIHIFICIYIYIYILNFFLTAFFTF